MTKLAFHPPFGSKPAAIAFLAILLALRVFWVPAHLALEPHDGVDVHGSAHSHDDHDHEPHPDHPPHSAADHLTELIGSRANVDCGVALVEVEGGPTFVEHAPVLRRAADEPAEPVPKPTPLRSDRARAPPLA